MDVDDTAEYVPPTPPDSLGRAGKALWRSIVKDFELHGAELRLLFDACSEADLIADMEKEWQRLGKPMTSRGSRNQDVSHPIVSELRQHRAVLSGLIRSLKLPAVVDEEPEDTGVFREKLTPSEYGRDPALSCCPPLSMQTAAPLSFLTLAT